MNQISPFENHTIYYQSPLLKTPEEAEVILLTEYHDQKSDHLANAALINKLIQERSILLLEGIRSNHQIEPNRVKYTKTLPLIDQPQHLTCFGWDHYHHCADDGSSYEDGMPDEIILNFNPSAADFFEQADIFQEKVAADFPKRTAAMTNTLKNREALKKEGLTGRCFQISGTDHLVEASTDPRHSLKLLYETLDKMKGIVLIPKKNYRILQNASD